MKITGNEPANPIRNEGGFCTDFEYVIGDNSGAIGLTIRQQFAMAAMSGLCATPEKGNYASMEELCERAAQISVTMADALINELNK